MGPFLLCVALAAFIFYVYQRHAKAVVCLFVSAIVLRVIFCFLHVYIGYATGIGSDLMGDAVGYSGGAAYIAELTRGADLQKELIADELANLLRFRQTYKGWMPDYNDWRVDGFTYYLGLVYTFFGYSPVTVKLINSLLFVIAAYVIYRYLLHYFGGRAAFAFLPPALFIPSAFFWSVSGLKDQMIAFFFILGIFSLFYLANALRDRRPFLKTSGFAFLLILSCAGIWLLRPRIIAVFFLMSGLTALLYIFAAAASSRVFKAGILVSMACLIFLPAVQQAACKIYKSFTHKSVSKCMVYQYDAATWYQIYPDRYNHDEEMKTVGITKFNPPSLREFALMTAIGFYHLFFAPLPWFARTRMEFFVSIEGIFMLITFFWAARGVLSCFRNPKAFSAALPLVVPFFILTTLFIYFEGNVGTLLRHKSAVLPFYCAFLAIGIGGVAPEEK